MRLLLPALCIVALCATMSDARSRFSKLRKIEPKPVFVHTPKLNTDALPSLQEILAELDLSEYTDRLVKMGVTETRNLLRLQKMDFRMMVLDWGDDAEDAVAKLQQRAQELLPQAIVPEVVVDPVQQDRDKHKQGRVYFPQFVQSFEYISASFGGPAPYGPLSIHLADPLTGCDASALTSAAGKLLIVTRGECTFLEKALAAKEAGVAALAIINSEDKLESVASGVGIVKNVTEALVLTVKDLPVISFPNTTLAPLQQAWSYRETSAPLLAHVVPMKCGGKSGKCLPFTKEEAKFQYETSWGHIRINSNKEVRSFDFLTSTFGGYLPSNPLSVVSASPRDGCSPLTHRVDNMAVFLQRGNCRFDVKALHAQEAGARLVIIGDFTDSALQRLGGMHPTGGYVGIPSVIIPGPGAVAMEGYLASGDVTVTLHPEQDSSGADIWIDLAHTEWADDDEDKASQLEGMLEKYRNSGVDVTTWLKRQLENIRSVNVKTIDTDEFLL